MNTRNLSTDSHSHQAGGLLRKVSALTDPPSPLKWIALCSASSLLVACGGGGDSVAGSTAAAGVMAVVQSAQERMLTESVRQRCEMDDPIRTIGSQAFQTTIQPRRIWAFSGGSVQIDKVYNVGQGEASATKYALASTALDPNENLVTADAVLLATSAGDFRVNPDNVLVSAGTADPQRRMGVLMPAALPDQAAGCVTPAHHAPRIGGLTPVRVGSLLWNSHQFQQALPLQTLPGHTVDAFEFVSNFSPAGGVAFFSLPKSRIAQPMAMTICRLTASGAAWRCELPRRQDTATHWVWAVDGPVRGVYVLVSSQPDAGS